MLLLASMLGSIMPCDFTVDHDIGDAVAAQPIGAMNAACYLAGSEKAGHGRFIGAKDDSDWLTTTMSVIRLSLTDIFTRMVPLRP